MAATT
jgi:hypothetical protein